MMSGLHTDVQLVKRFERKLERLEKQCSERYQLRETKVLNTLAFCVTTLEQLQNWATFAIFPQDEGQAGRYLGFIEFKYKCIINPLRILYSAMFHCEPPTPDLRTRDGGAEDGRERHGPGGDRSPDLESVADSLPAGADARTLQQQLSNFPLTARGSDDQDLRNNIEGMTRKYIQEGHLIRDEVEKRLAKNRKDINILYRWSKNSLMDLHDLLDDTLADELYFSVRGKMARILCSMSEVEEAADKIEKTLVSQLEGGGNNQDAKSSESKTDARSDHSNNSGAERSAGQGHSTSSQSQDIIYPRSRDSYSQGRSSPGQGHRQSSPDQHYQEASHSRDAYRNNTSIDSCNGSSPEDGDLNSFPVRQRNGSRDMERPVTRRSERPPAPVPPLWDSTDEAPQARVAWGPVHSAPGPGVRKDSPSPGRSYPSAGPSGRSPSPLDHHRRMSHRGFSPEHDPPGSQHKSRFVKHEENNNDTGDSARGIQAEFPQPGTILRARSEQSQEDNHFSPERPSRLRVDKMDKSPRAKHTLEKDPYRPPLEKQNPLPDEDGKIPVKNYPPLPMSDRQRQSSVLDSSEYPDLPGQKSLTDRGDYRRGGSPTAEGDIFSFSVGDVGRESGQETSSGGLGRNPSLNDLEGLDSASAGTPEPPTSPRPKGLVNHPKIVKDMLQSFTLPNKFLQNTW